MQEIFKLEKVDGVTMKYEIYFETEKDALKWITDNKSEGFMTISIKKIPLKQKVTKGLTGNIVIRN